MRISDIEKLRDSLDVGDKVQIVTKKAVDENRKIIKTVKEYEIIEKSRYIFYGKSKDDMFRKAFQYQDIWEK
ncbi:MAG: hypothetical protein MJ230_01665 [bacterium]|nr:hypothetical protein [bacterium]